MWKNNTGESKGFLPGRQTLGPLALILTTPPFAIILWYVCAHLDGSLSKFGELVLADGFLTTMYAIYPSWASMLDAGKFIGGYTALQLAFMRLLPGKEFKGPVSPAGHVPVYTENGLAAVLGTFLTYALCVHAGVFPMGYIYQILGPFLAMMSVCSFFFCLMLYIKGRVAPSGPDSGSSGNMVVDFYWGMELYPRVFGWDVKVFTNCRFGMMAMTVFPVDFALRQYVMHGFIADSMLVSAGLILVYCLKFFYWESGYWCSMDIMHDRAGYYICWGCLVWVPSVYVSQPMYLVNHPVQLGLPLASFFFLAGLLCIWSNYDSDRQRQQFRQDKGLKDIWGRKPAMIAASYTTEKGEEKESLLLASGWWGLARHYHYLPEVLAAFFWSVPALFDNALPFFYPFYLSILLLDRAHRDDERCRSKYGKHWAKYCERVPSRIIPYLY